MVPLTDFTVTICFAFVVCYAAISLIMLMVVIFNLNRTPFQLTCCVPLLNFMCKKFASWRCVNECVKILCINCFLMSATESHEHQTSLSLNGEPWSFKSPTVHTKNLKRSTTLPLPSSDLATVHARTTWTNMRFRPTQNVDLPRRNQNQS